MTDAAPRRQPPADVRWAIHDLTVGSLAGFTVGFVAGLFAMSKLVEHIALPFTFAVVGAVAGGWWLLASARGGTRIAVWRVVAWVLFALATAFLAMLMVAISTFE